MVDQVQPYIGLHGPSPILGPDGSPAQRKPIIEEVARPEMAGVRALWDETVASGLTPQRLASIMIECRRGDIRQFLTLAEEMEERFPHYAAVVGTRKRALDGIKPGISSDSPPGVPKAVLEDVEALVRDPSFPDLAEDLLDGLAKGFSVCEIAWEARDGKWWPREFVWRDPKYFTFDFISRSTLRLAELGTVDGVEIPPGKFIQHLPRLKAGIPIRAGLAYSVAWMFMFSSFTVKDWMAFMDVFGMPLRVGKYHPMATPDERRALLRAVTQIATDAGAVIPESMQIEFIEPKGNSQAPFEDAARFFNEQVSKLVLGQTMTSDNGSSLGQAKIHNEIRIDILQADARQLAKTVNRDLIRWFVAYNYGLGVPCPQIEFPVKKPEDVKVLSASLAELVPLGLEVSQSDIMSKLGLSPPQKGDKLLKAPTGAAPQLDKSALSTGPSLNNSHVNGCQCGGCRRLMAYNSSHVDDPTDVIRAEGLADWEPQANGLIEGGLKAAKKAKSYEEFSALIDQLYGKVRPDALEGSLAAMLKQAFELGQQQMRKG